MSADGHILGEDGRIHTGEVERRFSGTIMLTDCGAVAMRALSASEVRLLTTLGQRGLVTIEDTSRICTKCMEEEDHDDAD